MSSMSVCSFLNAMLWFGVFVMITARFCRSTDFMSRFGVASILFMFALSLARVLLVFEFPYTRVIGVRAIGGLYPFLRSQIPFLEVTNFAALMVIWIVVACVILGTSACRYFLFSYQMRRLPKCCSTQAERIMKDVQRTSKYKAAVQIIQSKEIPKPMMFGFRKPVILLPEVDLEDAQLHYILLHEWNHFTGKDTYTKLLVQILCSIFWWFPPVYLLKCDLNHTLEIRCDQRTILPLSEDNRIAYTETLLDMCRISRQPKMLPPFTLGMVTVHPRKKKRNMQLRQRFELILSFEDTRKHATRGIVAFVLIACATFVTSLAFIIQPSSEPDFLENTADSEYLYITRQNSYIVQHHDGTYWLYIQDLSEEKISVEFKNELVMNEEVPVFENGSHA